jgi:hypothetical protein
LVAGSLPAVAGLASPAPGALAPQQGSRDERPRPADDRSPSGAAGDDAAGAGTVLKCWQKGNLIFSEQNWRLTPQSLAGLSGPVFRSGGGAYGTLYLANFGDTFCFLKARDG